MAFNYPSISSRQKGVKYSIFAKISRKNFHPPISRQREEQKIQPFQKLFYLTSKIIDFMHSFLKNAKQKSRHTDIKNRRELCSRFKMMFYVTALKFKDGTVITPIHSLTVPKRIEWWVTVFSLSIPPALGGFATSQSYIYSVAVPHKRNFIIHYLSIILVTVLNICHNL